MKRVGYASSMVALVAVIILVLPTLLGAVDSRSEDDKVTEIGGTECTGEGITTSILLDAGFEESQFVLGEENFDLSLPAVNDRGNGSFSDSSMTSREELGTFLNSGTPEAETVVERVSASTGSDPDVVSDPENWTGFQLLIPSLWEGNTFYKNGSVTPANSTRHSDVGDIGWIFVDPDDCSSPQVRVVNVALLRGPCTNPQDRPPVPPEPPEGTTTTTTPSSTTTTTVVVTTTTEAPGKDHERSPISDDPNDPEEEKRPVVICDLPKIVDRDGNCVDPPPETTTTTEAPAPPTEGDEYCEATYGPGWTWDEEIDGCADPNSTSTTVPDSGDGGIGDGEEPCDEGYIRDPETGECVLADDVGGGDNEDPAPIKP